MCYGLNKISSDDKNVGVMIVECSYRNTNQMMIISQNLYNYRKKNDRGTGQIKSYLNNYKADVYAFQEFPEWGRGKTFHTTFYDKNGENRGYISEVEKLWGEYFVWSDFPKRYWAEMDVYFNNVKVKVINIHIPTSNYQDQLRFVLLKRLEQLVNEPVVLLGDFNAAFSYQTEKVIEGNDKFLSVITADKGYIEICGEEENTEFPHYTYAIKSSKTKLWEKKKLDHIFVSPKLSKLKWKMYIEYIDDVNINLVYINGRKPSDAFTDHSGLKLIIESGKI